MAGIKMTDANGKLFSPARYSHMYKLTTMQEKNDQGSWFGWDVSLVKAVDDQGIYALAKDFASQVKAGAVQAGPPPREDQGPVSEDF